MPEGDVPEGFEDAEELEATVDKGKATVQWKIPDDATGDYIFVASVDGKDAKKTSEPLKVQKNIFLVVVQNDPDESPDDQVTLKRDDDSWSDQKSLSEGEERADGIAVKFEGLPFSSRPNQTFTCEVQRGSGEKFFLFTRLPICPPE